MYFNFVLLMEFQIVHAVHDYREFVRLSQQQYSVTPILLIILRVYWPQGSCGQVAIAVCHVLNLWLTPQSNHAHVCYSISAAC